MISRLFFRLALLALILGGAVALWKHLEKSRPEEFAQQPETTYREPDPLATIRIATWDLSPLNFEKMRDPERLEKILAILSDFDLVAIQGVSARNNAPLIKLINKLQRGGKNMSFACSQDLGTAPEYLAFLYDQDRIMIDRATLADVVDPNGRLTTKPLSALFRTTEPTAEKAFTFTLINVKLDPARAATERELLPDIYRSFRDNSLGEDDIILLGSFSLPVHELGPIATLPEMSAVHRDLVTTIDGRWSIDNILLHRRATSEYVERLGTVDFVQVYDMNLDEAANLSSHLPLWADFSIFEGGQP